MPKAASLGYWHFFSSMLARRRCEVTVRRGEEQRARRIHMAVGQPGHAWLGLGLGLRLGLGLGFGVGVGVGVGLGFGQPGHAVQYRAEPLAVRRRGVGVPLLLLAAAREYRAHSARPHAVSHLRRVPEEVALRRVRPTEVES